MSDQGAGRSTSRRNSTVSLGLVGVPHVVEPIQTVDEFIFDFDPAVAGLDTDFNARIDALCAAGLPDGQALQELQTTSDSTLNTGLEPSGSFEPYDLTDYSSFPEQQSFMYPEPQDYFMAHEAPYFSSGYGSLDPTLDFYNTMGLTAIPGNNTFIEDENSQAALQPYEQTDYIPGDNSSCNNTSVQFATYPPEELQVATTNSVFSAEPIPSPVGKPDTQYETDSGSDDEYRNTKVKTTKATKASKRATQKKRDSVSSASTSATPAEPAKYLPGEKPKKVDTKPWIRTNANTEGDTRTSKINNWKNKYGYKPLPLGTWSFGKHTFTYTQYENVDFLTEAPMSTRKISDYIFKYPSDDDKRLILWIQKMPADQGRRYGSKQHSKCAFRDCPMQRYVEGTISTGEYRVAFDEKHHTYGDRVDPYDCTAYAHLYCMEQFLDFERVCQEADVRIDTRLDMPLEPNGRAAFSMVDVPARHEIGRFLKAASQGKLRQSQHWYNYPLHADYKRDEQKPHECTLTYLAHCMYEAHQDDSHKRQAALRRVTVSQRRVHLGDLEMSVADKRIMLDVYGGKKKARNAKLEDHYDERILYHITRAEQEAKAFLEGKRRKKTSAKKSKKRKIGEGDDTDEEEEFTCSTQSRGTRTTRQKKQRVNYAESPVMQQYAQASYAQPRPVQPASTLEQQVQHLQTHVATNFSPPPKPAPTQPPIDPMLALDFPFSPYTVPATPKFDISDFPTCEDDLPSDNLEKVLALERRQSFAAELGPTSILKSPAYARTPRSVTFARRVGFEAQPVSASKVYRVDDPPTYMSGRRSARLAKK
ncbi:hypothetical protein C7974DRAFT_26531 [Boeremia exigua]|uniref:uncharacterized protein n=1 Tax=Boeremia exigua TaxID=749465 RepID=UPI001E8D87E9|nr:uncharacterized protein C7974DRAFT_26531 [Boeremia exigua]KAH6644707.1 hypothetical protein C7974DRAFT_26531 [Boeremia exigua]